MTTARTSDKYEVMVRNMRMTRTVCDDAVGCALERPLSLGQGSAVTTLFEQGVPQTSASEERAHLRWPRGRDQEKRDYQVKWWNG